MTSRGRVRISGSAGFTLIELLAVLMIIGVLAALGVPRYFRSVERSRISDGVKAAKLVVEAVGRNCLRFNTLPTIGFAAAPPGCPAPGGILTVGDAELCVRYFNAPALGGTCAGYNVTITRNGQECNAVGGCTNGMGPITMNQDGNITDWGTIPDFLRI